jgi:hypothetical protein
VIIYGGVNVNYDVLYGDVAVLDTTQPQYIWSIKETRGATPPARYSHTATMVGTNMLIAFGMYSFTSIISHIHTYIMYSYDIYALFL